MNRSDIQVCAIPPHGERYKNTNDKRSSARYSLNNFVNSLDTDLVEILRRYSMHSQ